MEETIECTVNGKAVSLKTDPARMLLWVLRTDLGLTGTKYGCGEGICGACTVHVNGEAVRSCRTAVGDVAGKQIVTIEGLAVNGELKPIQKAFMEHDAMQCGYCTPGMIMTAHEFLQKHPKPSRQDIVEGMENNLCRCGAHRRIIEAIEAASKETASR